MQEVILTRRVCNDGFTRFYIKYKPALDIPNQKPLDVEALDLKLYTHPKYPFQETANRQIAEIAEKVYAARMVMVARRQYAFRMTDNRNVDFLLYFEENGDYRGSKYTGARKAFSSFMGGTCKIKDISISLLEKYKKYLSTYISPQKKKKISHNTACSYFAILLSILRLAYKDNLLNKDYSILVSKIKWDHEIKRDYLSEDEIRRIEETDFPIAPQVRLAALLSIQTGLRRSDILNLKWSNIKSDTASGLCIDIKVHKTGSRLILPLSEKARMILIECGMNNPHSDKIFPNLTDSILNKRISQLIKKAGICKHITFHCFRHTFAMMLLNKGADIYRISKLLGHAQINNTAVYAKLSTADLKKCISEMLDDED